MVSYSIKTMPLMVYVYVLCSHYILFCDFLNFCLTIFKKKMYLFRFFCMDCSYVSLSDNEKTGYKARELKSVHVDAVGTFLRLNIHKNHINKHNLYNQVNVEDGGEG